MVPPLSEIMMVVVKPAGLDNFPKYMEEAAALVVPLNQHNIQNPREFRFSGLSLDGNCGD